MPVSIAVHAGTTVPIYRQIVEQICTAAIAGKIRDDEPLPSVRALAETLVVNPNTVARAYAELAREGIVESRPGRGMFLAERRRIYSAPERARRIEQAARSFVSEAFLLGYDAEEIIELVARQTRTTRKAGKGGAR